MHQLAGMFLEMVRDRIRQGWIQGPTAKDAAGRTVHPSDPTAAAWCLQGAVERVMGEWYGAFLYHGEVYLLPGAAAFNGSRAAISALWQRTWCYPHGPGSLALFNEYPGRTKEEVLALLTETLADFQAQPKLPEEGERVAAPPAERDLDREREFVLPGR